MPREKTVPPNEPRACDARRCPHCHVVEFNERGEVERVTDKPKPLTPDDLAWEFGHAESALGIRSTLGAFVDMALSGVQSGGKSNGIESQAVEVRRLRATAKHRCIRARLAHLTPSQREVLQTAYGPDDWTRSIGDVDVRAAVEIAITRAKITPQGARLLPMTALAMEHAARRQNSRLPPPSRPRRQSAEDLKNLTDAERLAYKVRWYMHEQHGLHASPRGAVISAACSTDKTRLCNLSRQAIAMLDAARAAAGVVELQAPRRVRAVQLGTAEVRPHA